LALTAERLPFEDHTFDTIVVTWSLCSIPDPTCRAGVFRTRPWPRAGPAATATPS
jgi:hypothetical protein